MNIMTNSNINFVSKILLFRIIIPLFLLTSCSSSKAVYFNKQSAYDFQNSTGNPDPIIKPNDLLSIVVSSVNPDAAELFNVSRNSVQQSSTNVGITTRVSGYLVDTDGFINFPILGKIKADGGSKKKLTEKITTMLTEQKLLLEPIVDIRYLNFRVSVLGEVKNPRVISVSSEKISLLEALSMAGDITIFGRRDNVTLIREELGVKKTEVIDLTTNEIFNSPYYYLQSNDIIYVQPNRAKVTSSTGVKSWIPVILSAISLAVIVIVNL